MDVEARSINRSGRLAKFASVLLLAALLTVGPTTPASAHSGLDSSSPGVGDVLTKAPASVELVFNEEMRDFAPQVAITVGTLKPLTFTPKVAGNKVTVDLDGTELPSDPTSIQWKIGYRVVSGDGHPASGVVEFSVADHEVVPGGSMPASADTDDTTEVEPIPQSDGATRLAGQPLTDPSPQDSTPSAWWAWLLAAVAAVGAAAAGIWMKRLKKGGRSQPQKSR